MLHESFRLRIIGIVWITTKEPQGTILPALRQPRPRGLLEKSKTPVQVPLLQCSLPARLRRVLRPPQVYRRILLGQVFSFPSVVTDSLRVQKAHGEGPLVADSQDGTADVSRPPRRVLCREREVAKLKPGMGLFGRSRSNPAQSRLWEET